MNKDDIQVGKKYIVNSRKLDMPERSSEREVEEVTISELSKNKEYAKCKEYPFWFSILAILDVVD